jgi:proteasome accessory factor A
MAEELARIHGTEMEWSVSAPIVDSAMSSQLDELALQAHMNAYLANQPHLVQNRQFLSNGARFYVDVGVHPEYATQETDSIVDGTAAEFAGESKVRAMLETPSQNYGQLAKFNLNKRVADEADNTTGYHESYSVNARTMSISRDKLALLGIHLATRTIYTGAGLLQTDGSYQLAQKAPSLSSDFESTTTRDKPVVNMRDEPHADPEQSRRVHITCGDPNMSPWATRLKLGSTSLALRLIENGEQLPGLRFAKPLHEVAKAVSADTRLQNRYQLKSGESLTAIEVQKQLLARYQKLDKQLSLPDEEQRTIDELDRVLYDLEKDPARLVNRADWVGKYKALERYRDRHGCGWDSQELRNKDGQWDVIDEKGLGMKMRETVWAEWMPPESLIKERMTTPPATTRAALRGAFITAFANKLDTGVDWEYCRAANHTVTIKDPRATYSEELAKLIAAAPYAAPALKIG